jgi:chromate reductase, NAD(P)H dehydrogenase (quinone)
LNVLVLALSGSLRTGSFNTALLRAAGGLLPPGARLELHDSLAPVPPYSEDDDVEPVPGPVALLRGRVAAADALLVATPEYNGSVPGQLKNALDWASRPFPANALRDTPVAVVGASTGLFGAVWAQAELRKVLATAGAAVLDHELAVPDAPAAFDPQLRLTDPAVAAAFRELLRVLVLTASQPQAAEEGRPCAIDSIAAGHSSPCQASGR